MFLLYDILILNIQKRFYGKKTHGLLQDVVVQSYSESVGPGKWIERRRMRETETKMNGERKRERKRKKERDKTLTFVFIRI